MTEPSEGPTPDPASSVPSNHSSTHRTLPRGFRARLLAASAPGHRQLRWPAWVALAAALLAIAAIGVHGRASVRAGIRKELEFAAAEILQKIEDRLSDQEQLLLAGAALLNASDGVTRETWKRYCADLRIEARYPGIQGVGYALLVPRESLDQHLREVRAEGFPDYRIWPAAQRQVVSSIVFLEPFEEDNLRAFGYDMLSEPVRRAAMERARDENRGAISKRVILVQESGADTQSGTLMYVPVYRKGARIDSPEARRAAIVGWVFSPYRMDDLMKGILGGWNRPGRSRLRLQLFDDETSSTEGLLWDSQAAEREPQPLGRLILQAPVRFHETHATPWTARFSRTSFAPWWTDSRVLVASFGALAIGLLLFALVRAWLNTRVTAMKIARQLTQELRDSQLCMDLAIRASGLMLWNWDVAARRIESDSLWTQLLGYGPDVVPRSEPEWEQMVHPDDLAALRAAITSHLWRETPFAECEVRFRHRDGRWLWLRAHGRIVELDANGAALRAAGTVIDITSSKHADEALQRSRAELLCVLASTGDGILAVDAERNMILANDRFARLWSIPPEILATKSDEKALAHVLNQLVDPEAFLARVESLYGTPDDAMDTIELKGGRVFERYSAPLMIEGQVAGRVWSFRDATSRHRAEAALRSSLREKEVLLREIHHRVKNNMQVITSLLNLQASSLADEGVRVLFEESKSRVASMALIHEKLYRSEDLASIDFGAYATALARDLLRVYSRPEVALAVDMGGVFLDVTLGIPCGLIINELVSNSLKHAFPAHRSGTIRVEMKGQVDGDYQLSVTDDGIGLPPSFDWTKSESLGLRLIQVLSGQIGGSVAVTSDSGTSFVIRFPARSES